MTQKGEQQISQEPRRHETNRCSRLSLTELCEVFLKSWSITNKMWEAEPSLLHTSHIPVI